MGTHVEFYLCNNMHKHLEWYFQINRRLSAPSTQIAPIRIIVIELRKIVSRGKTSDAPEGTFSFE